MSFKLPKFNKHAAKLWDKTPTARLTEGITKNPAVHTFATKLGFGKQESDKAAEKELEDSKQAYRDLAPPELTKEQPEYAKTFDQAPSEYNKIATDPAYKESQQQQIAALRNLAANGGRNAASDANLAQIQQSENANARGQRDAILQNAQARGMGGSGASLLAQLSASQNATNNQSMQDLNVRGQDQNNALQAGMGAANLSSNMQNNDWNQQASKAQANDAINRYNSGQQTANSQFNAGVGNQAQQFNSGLEQTGYQNQVQKTAGLSGTSLAGVNYNQAQSNLGAQQAGNVLGGVTKVGAAAAQAAAAAHGGRVGGAPVVKGDSSLNDFVPIKASPGEVVVPRSLIHSSPEAISSFVKHPPQVTTPDRKKEAMLSALRNIRARR